MDQDHFAQNQEQVKLFSEAAGLMDCLLQCYTGLAEHDRKKLVYYVLATHCLPFAQLFPLAVLCGVQSTGKTSAMRVARFFAYKPLWFCASGSTLPTLRDALVEGHESTVFLEEADSTYAGTEWFETLLANRFHRDSAKVALKVPAGDGGYVTKEQPCFGPTILHRRKPFLDSATEGRSIIIRSYPVHGGSFLKTDEMGWETTFSNDPAVTEIEGATFKPTSLGQPPAHIDGRVWDTHTPLLAVARMVGDSGFETDSLKEMEVNTMVLREGQTMAELEPISVRGVIRLISQGGNLKFDKGVSLKEIKTELWKSEGISATSFQLSRIFDQLGIEKRKAHGDIKIYLSPAKLVEVCTLLGIEDEAVAELAKKLKKP